MRKQRGRSQETHCFVGLCADWGYFMGVPATKNCTASSALSL